MYNTIIITLLTHWTKILITIYEYKNIYIYKIYIHKTNLQSRDKWNHDKAININFFIVTIVQTKNKKIIFTVIFFVAFFPIDQIYANKTIITNKQNKTY